MSSSYFRTGVVLFLNHVLSGVSLEYPVCSNRSFCSSWSELLFPSTMWPLKSQLHSQFPSSCFLPGLALWHTNAGSGSPQRVVYFIPDTVLEMLAQNDFVCFATLLNFSNDIYSPLFLAAEVDTTPTSSLVYHCLELVVLCICSIEFKDWKTQISRVPISA